MHKVTGEKGALVFSFVIPGSTLYHEAVSLRHSVLFEPHGILLQEVPDGLEEKSIHLVAIAAGRLTGYGRLTVGIDAARISQMVVSECWRGRGVGAGLVERLVERAAEAGAAIVTLDARVSVTGFYQKLGFVPEGEIFPSPRTGLPHRRMVKNISGKGTVIPGNSQGGMNF